MRIGVFGGTFDPPHVGHLLLAADACDALRLDKLIFVPAAAQPFKVDAPAVASPRDRLEMVRLAVGDDPRYSVDDTEIAREGLSYTVDTLEEIARRNIGAKLFLLVGEDALDGFPGWRNPERIAQLATLAVMHRGPSSASREASRVSGTVAISTRQVDVSSTEIRARLGAGKSIRGFVTDAVERFVGAKGLYR